MVRKKKIPTRDSQSPVHFDPFQLHWVKQMETKVQKLEKKGYKLDWARSVLGGQGTVKDLHDRFRWTANFKCFNS